MRIQASAGQKTVVQTLLLSVAWLPAEAQWVPDPPKRVQIVKEGNGSETTCTYYPDLVLRVTQTDTPSPGHATLFGRHPPQSDCSVISGSGVSLKTAAFRYVGRKGPYLFFEEADPNGATAFSVFDARSGRRIVRDTTQSGLTRGSLHAVAATANTLHLTFQRGVNTKCSILAAPTACWRAITRSSRGNIIPSMVARLLPPVQACSRSYELNRAERDNPSMIAYEVKVTWARFKSQQVQAIGPVNCAPAP